MPPEPTHAPTQEQYRDAALRCGAWMLRNQVQAVDDANRGRYLQAYFLRFKRGKSSVGFVPGAKKRRRAQYSVCWTTATAAMAAHMLYERTGDEEYLESARLAAGYLKLLQVLNPRDPDHGLIWHDIPGYGIFGPNRDATTAAWAMTKLSAPLQDPDLLERALVYAERFRKERFDARHAFPLWPNRRAEGRAMGQSCCGGEFAFLLDLYQATGETTWLEDLALPGLDTFARAFIRPDGELNLTYDFDAQEPVSPQPDARGYVDRRHVYNDDFSSLALLKAYAITGEKRYLDATKRYLDWMASVQHPDGSFGEPRVYRDASGTVAIELADLHAALGEPVHSQALAATGAHLLSLQVPDTDKSEVAGAFYGLTPWERLPFCCVHLRTSGYAVAALLKLEAARTYHCYTAAK